MDNLEKNKRNRLKVKREEEVLLSYGRFCRSIDSLRHYDSLQSENEEKVSNANLYAVAAAAFLFFMTTNPILALVVCMTIGLADIMYISACYITSLINAERFDISLAYELLKNEKKEKKDEGSEQKFIHHETSYLKAIYYIMHLSIPFTLLIFTPAYVLLKMTAFYDYINQLIPIFPYQLIVYILICAGIFIGFSFLLFKVIGARISLKTMIREQKLF